MTMNKRECELVIFNRMQEIMQILKKYNPDAAMLSLCFIGEHEDDESGESVPDYIGFNTNRGEDKEKTIDFSAFNNPPWVKKSGWSLNFTEPEAIYEF